MPLSVRLIQSIPAELRNYIFAFSGESVIVKHAR